MKLETAKSLILVVLIGTSMILTFGMWNYQGEYNALSERSVEVDFGGEEKSVSEIVMPSNIVFKADGLLYGHAEPSEMDRFYNRMQDWRITEFETQIIPESQEGRTPDIYEIEVILSQEVPIEVFDYILQIEDDPVPFPTFSIDRFYITFEPESMSLQLEFVSIDGRETAQAVVNSASTYEEVSDEMNRLQGNDYKSLIQVEGAGEDIYIPREAPAMNPLSVFFTPIDNSVIQDVLFTNPSVVRATESPGNGYLYITDVRQLRIHRNVMDYIYFTEQTGPISEIELIDRSRQQINGHSGFTEDFRLMNINNDVITYQMYYDGYPTFRGSSPDVATIQQKFNNQHLLEYRRPVIHLETANPITLPEKELRSGEEVLEDIQTNPSINMESLNDLRIGYQVELETDENGDYVSMEPDWFMKINNNWTIVPLDDPDKPALEGGD